MVAITLFIGTLLYFRTEIKVHFTMKDDIVWSPDVKVWFKDYEGKPNDSSESQIYGWHGYYLSYEGCWRGSYEYEIVTFFDKKKSWVKDSTTQAAQQQIQLHRLRFDLYEVFAQKFRNELESLEDPCGYGQARIDSIGDRYFVVAEKVWDQVLDSEYPTFEEKMETWKEVVDQMMRKVK